MGVTFLGLVKIVKINFAQCVLEQDTGSVLDYQFEISPRDFLSYSKQDFKTNDKRGNVNALTNAKRAIDCQTDKIFSSLGLDPSSFPSVIEEFKSQTSPLKKDLPIKLRFLQAIAFAPAEIISNPRLLRNKLEHYYKKPSDEEVSSAIELAELFILATDNKLKSVWDFSISDRGKYSKNKGELGDSIHIIYNYEKHLFNVRAYFGEDDKEEIRVKNTDTLFYYLLKVATSFDYEQDTQDAATDLIEFIGHPMPKKHISIELH